MLAADTRQIFGHALDRIGRAEVLADPFPHLLVDDFLPQDVYENLLRNFPDRTLFEKVVYPGTGHGRRTAHYHAHGLAYRDLKGHESFGVVSELFSSEAFSRALLDKFSRVAPEGSSPIPVEKHPLFKDGASDFTSVFDLQIDLPGYEIPPHPDNPQKIVTYQYFLMEDDSLRDFGTLFCRPKDGRTTADRGRLAGAAGRLIDRLSARSGFHRTGLYRRLERSPLGLRLGVGTTRGWLPWDLFEVAKVAPALPNHFMAFAPNRVSYHAVRLDIPADSPRQERPVVRGFIRSGKDTTNWIEHAKM
jgi:hypothetical protein